MALKQSKSKKTEDAIMRGVIEIEAFQHLVCSGEHPLDEGKPCDEPVMIITVVMTGRETLACGGYCAKHMFMLEPYVALSRKKIGIELEE